MCQGEIDKGANDSAGRILLLENQVRCLEARLARHEPDKRFDLDRMLYGPQRKLTPQKIDTETERLLKMCADQGVSAVVPQVATCRDLLLSLAQACHRADLKSAFQYLNYLASPYE
jgi:hypothetical protein